MDMRRVFTATGAGDAATAAAAPPLGLTALKRPSLKQQYTFGSFGTSRSDWFMDLFGFREVSYEETQRRLKVWPMKDSPDATWFMQGETGRSYQVGRFWTPSLRELEAAAREQGGLAALPGRLRVQNIRGDVSEQLGSSENRHATFQVASQFNCLEYVSPEMRPEFGVTGYVRDRTQGPACCVACGPATVFRNYFAPMEGGVGQRHNRQLNNLRDLSERLGNKPEGRFFKVVGGYTLATDRSLRDLNAEIDSLRDEAYEAIRRELRVGLHEDVQVTSSYWGECPVEDEEQTVTQVLGSACSVSYSDNSRLLWEPLARLVLSASYEATLWAALLAALRHGGKNGSRRVYLTCLGGGVFGNDSRWITDAMADAFHKFRNCNLEVYIVVYGGPFDPNLERLQRQFGGR